MNWTFIAILAPLLWAIVNHVDKYLLSNHFKGKNVGALMVFSTITSIVVLPVAYFTDSSILNILPINALLLVIVGILSAVAIWLYLIALDKEEASIVVPLFQTIPIFGFIFAYLMLGEVLSGTQFFGCLVIILGSVILTLEFDEENRLKVKKSIAFLMLGSAAIFGFYETLFKVAAIKESFWVATFWESVGLLSFGLLLLLIKDIRQSFTHLVKVNSFKIFSLNIGSEVLTIIGNIITNYALLIAPVALILVLTGIQPALVLLIGILLTIFFPKISKENIEKKHFFHKLSAIIIIVIGVTMIQ